MADRWVIRTLIASIAVNVFLIGAAVTTLIRSASSHQTMAIQRTTFRSAATSLTDKHREAFIALLTSEGRLVQADNQRARRMRDQAWASFSAPTFQPEAVKAELASARAISLQSRGRVEAAVVDFASALPPPERAALGDALRRVVVRQRAPTSLPPRQPPTSPAGGR